MNNNPAPTAGQTWQHETEAARVVIETTESNVRWQYKTKQPAPRYWCELKKWKRWAKHATLIDPLPVTMESVAQQYGIGTPEELQRALADWQDWRETAVVYGAKDPAELYRMLEDANRIEEEQ